MITPSMKLPIKEVLSKNKKKYQIVDRDNNIIIDDVKELSDALFIENAVNNYHKAIELLKEIDKNWTNIVNSDNYVNTYVHKVEDFLKSI